MGEFTPNPHYVQYAESGQLSSLIPAILSRSEQFYYAQLLSQRLEQTTSQLRGYTEKQENIFEIRNLAAQLRGNIHQLRESVVSTHQASSKQFQVLVSTAKMVEQAEEQFRNVSEARALFLEAKECVRLLAQLSLAVEANVSLRGAFERALDTATGLCSNFSEDRMGDFRRACSELEAQQNAVPLRDVVFGLVTLESETLGKISGLALSVGLKRQCRLLKVHVFEAVLKPALNIWLADLQDKTPSLGRVALAAAEKSLLEGDQSFCKTLDGITDCNDLLGRLDTSSGFEAAEGPSRLSGVVSSLSQSAGGSLESQGSRGPSGPRGSQIPQSSLQSSPESPSPDSAAAAPPAIRALTSLAGSQSDGSRQPLAFHPEVLSDYLAYCEMLGFSDEAKEYLISARVQQLPKGRATIAKLLAAGATDSATPGEPAPQEASTTVDSAVASWSPRAASLVGPASLTPDLCALAGFVVTFQLLAQQVGGLDQDVFDTVTSRATGDVESLLAEFSTSKGLSEEECILFCRGASAIILVLSSVTLSRKRGQVSILTRDSHPGLSEACQGLTRTLNTSCFTVYRDAILTRAGQGCASLVQLGLPEKCAGVANASTLWAVAGGTAASMSISIVDALLAALQWSVPYCPQRPGRAEGLLARVAAGSLGAMASSPVLDVVRQGASGHRSPQSVAPFQGGEAVERRLDPKALTTLAVDLLVMGLRTPVQVLLEEYTTQDMVIMCALAHLLELGLAVILLVSGVLDVLETLVSGLAADGSRETGPTNSARGQGEHTHHELGDRPDMTKLLSDLTGMRVRFFNEILFQTLSHGAGEILATGAHISVFPSEGYHARPSFTKQVLALPGETPHASLLGRWEDGSKEAVQANPLPAKQLRSFAESLSEALLGPEDDAMARRFPDMARLAFLDSVMRLLEATANQTGTQFPGLIVVPGGVEQFQMDSMWFQSMEISERPVGEPAGDFSTAVEFCLREVFHLDSPEVVSALVSTFQELYLHAQAPSPPKTLSLTAQKNYALNTPFVHLLAYLLVSVGLLGVDVPQAAQTGARLASDIGQSRATVSSEFEQQIGQRFSLMTSLQNIMDSWSCFVLPASLQGQQLREAIASRVARLESRIEQYNFTRREVRILECVGVPQPLQASLVRVSQMFRECVGTQAFQRKFPERERRVGRQASPADGSPPHTPRRVSPSLASPVPPPEAAPPVSAPMAVTSEPQKPKGKWFARHGDQETPKSRWAKDRRHPGAEAGEEPSPSLPLGNTDAGSTGDVGTTGITGTTGIAPSATPSSVTQASGPAAAPSTAASPVPSGPVGAGTPIVIGPDGTVNLGGKGATKKPKGERKWGWKRDKSS